MTGRFDHLPDRRAIVDRRALADRIATLPDPIPAKIAPLLRDALDAGRAEIARRLAEQVLADGLPPGVLLNVNVPDGPPGSLFVHRTTRQARARWIEEFEERRDPMDRPYYWLGGRFESLDTGDDTDLAALADGCVSVTPLHFDLTAYAHLDHVRAWTDA